MKMYCTSIGVRMGYVYANSIHLLKFLDRDVLRGHEMPLVCLYSSETNKSPAFSSTFELPIDCALELYFPSVHERNRGASLAPTEKQFFYLI